MVDVDCKTAVVVAATLLIVDTDNDAVCSVVPCSGDDVGSGCSVNLWASHDFSVLG